MLRKPVQGRVIKQAFGKLRPCSGRSFWETLCYITMSLRFFSSCDDKYKQQRTYFNVFINSCALSILYLFYMP